MTRSEAPLTFRTASKDVGISKAKSNIDGAIPGNGKEKDVSF